ncbi:pyridoxamine 5'-phosphate oxidase family protein [Longivirga aurantiaca]|uniref:Pyridoxamine 5'-phosphate oxidase family protein n=1 Tax=Longivirga aurantiaca TaxID=1837743 RepID=A0ABW1SVA7_9ACTN
MSIIDREELLQRVLLAVLSVERVEDGPLVAPVWYEYRPTGQFLLLVPSWSPKAALMRRWGRASLCVYQDGEPQRYVSATGSVEVRELDEAECYAAMLSMAVRYEGHERGTEAAGRLAQDPVSLVTLTPHRWHAQVF